MNCNLFEEHVLDFIRDLMPPEEARNMRVHTETCARCKALVESYGLMPYILKVDETFIEKTLATAHDRVQHHKRRRNRIAGLAMAASVVVVATIASVWRYALTPPPTGLRLAQEFARNVEISRMPAYEEFEEETIEPYGTIEVKGTEVPGVLEEVPAAIEIPKQTKPATFPMIIAAVPVCAVPTEEPPVKEEEEETAITPIFIPDAIYMQSAENILLIKTKDQIGTGVILDAEALPFILTDEENKRLIPVLTTRDMAFSGDLTINLTMSVQIMRGTIQDPDGDTDIPKMVPENTLSSALVCAWGRDADWALLGIDASAFSEVRGLKPTGPLENTVAKISCSNPDNPWRYTRIKYKPDEGETPFLIQPDTASGEVDYSSILLDEDGQVTGIAVSRDNAWDIGALQELGVNKYYGSIKGPFSFTSLADYPIERSTCWAYEESGQRNGALLIIDGDLKRGIFWSVGAISGNGSLIMNIPTDIEPSTIRTCYEEYFTLIKSNKITVYSLKKTRQDGTSRILVDENNDGYYEYSAFLKPAAEALEIEEASSKGSARIWDIVTSSLPEEILESVKAMGKRLNLDNFPDNTDS